MFYVIPTDITKKVLIQAFSLKSELFLSITIPSSLSNPHTNLPDKLHSQSAS